MELLASAEQKGIAEAEAEAKAEAEAEAKAREARGEGLAERARRASVGSRPPPAVFPWQFGTRKRVR